MAWISVHQEVDGTKLRRLYQAIGCSKFEALGILNFLWFWGMKNADETGLAVDADLDVLSRYLYGCGENSDLDMGKVVQALVDVGWLDIVKEGIHIHDWDQWQEQWYKYQRTKEYNAKRMRETRSADKARKTAKAESGSEEAPKKPAKKEPEKKSYAEFVKMTEVSYNRLIELYGKEFADTCITELDLYKGSKGKTYKDDYRAILSWVVDRVKEKKPGLLEKSRSESAVPPSGNESPYAEWDDRNE